MSKKSLPTNDCKSAAPCDHCGKDVAWDDNYCPWCGQPHPSHLSANPKRAVPKGSTATRKAPKMETDAKLVTVLLESDLRPTRDGIRSHVLLCEAVSEDAQLLAQLTPKALLAISAYLRVQTGLRKMDSPFWN